ncbi:hypothetical protein ID866_11306 [Astraeus odoratus]|nr:hypothetical protein ID866_11306 [Astraeus odoratus]
MRAELMQGGNTYVEPNALISVPSMVIFSNPDLTVYSNSHLCKFTVVMPTYTMQMHLCTCTQTKHEDAKHYLSGSHQIPSTSDHHPPLSAHHSSPTTPCHEPHIRTLAKELEDAKFRTLNGPGGSNPDPKDPDNPDNDNGDDDNASNPSIKDNPILMLTNAITLLSCATRHKPKDLGTAHTKVHEPNTFDGMDPKKLHEFLVQCKLNFHNRPQAFCLDMWKVSFALSFLKGIALAWFKPDLLDTILGAESAWANDYSEFIIELTTNFGPHDPVGDAEHQLDNLSMKDSSCINKYIVEFNHLATQVHGYEEGALQHMFYNGLLDCIKDEIAHGIDACYWEHKSEIAHQAKTNPQPSSSSKQSLSGDHPPSNLATLLVPPHPLLAKGRTLSAHPPLPLSPPIPPCLTC